MEGSSVGCAVWETHAVVRRLHNPMMFCPSAVVWGDVATWVAGIATAGTLFFGMFQWARLRAQSLKDQREMFAEQRRAQARRVYAWLDGARGPGIVRVGNGSDEPVYGVVVHMVHMDGHKPGSGEETERNIADTLAQLRNIHPALAEGAARPVPSQFRAVVQTLPQGTYYLNLQVQQDNPGVEISFTDAAGRYWVRRVTGELTERKEDALDHYGIEAPVDYAQLISG